MEEETTQKIECNSLETQPVDEPLYISIEGLFDCPSPPGVETPTETRRGKRARKQKGSYYDDPDWELDFNSRSEDEFEPPVHTQSTVISGDVSVEGEDQLVALSKKQLNRLAAMEIYPIPSGGIGTVNASLFNPITVKWLMENFETVDGSSLPRFLVYNHYLLHCKSLDITPINAASFGKVIRSVFLGLQTRRLGTRGNSKYHYCGMRIKPDSPLLNISVSDCENRKSKGRNRKGSKIVIPLDDCDNDKSSPMSWTLKRYTEWWKTYIQDMPEDVKSIHLENLQIVMRPLEEKLNTNTFCNSIRRIFKDEDKMDILLSAMEEINFVQVDSQISWVSNDSSIACGQKLRNILVSQDRLQDLASWIEQLVEEKMSSNSLTMNEVKVKLQDILVGLSYYMTHVRKELMLISQDSLGTFNCMENFILEYLKHFAHLRIEMDTIIQSVLASKAETCQINMDDLTSICENDMSNNETNKDIPEDYENQIIKIEVDFPDSSFISPIPEEDPID